MRCFRRRGCGEEQKVPPNKEKREALAAMAAESEHPAGSWVREVDR